jgi:hypothetical protein
MKDTDFEIEFEGFNEGLSPLAHLDSKTFVGNKGQASEMMADVVSNPGFLQQSPALADLENGNQNGVVHELIRFILDRPTESNVTFAVGTSKLFRLSPDKVDDGTRFSSASSSVSPSVSPSTSPSVSVSPSASPSLSPSVSPSVSPSGSTSPSISPSVSVSPSKSPSVSPSVSISPSASPSTSPSISVSPSLSPSVSPSTLPSWPQTITGMTEGESIIRLKQNLYVFYNKVNSGDIAKMPLTNETIDATWGSTVEGGILLEKALHPVAAKEDIIVFGNGRYAGVFVEGLGTLDTQKLDFGEGSEVADIVFHANVWWIAVNYGEGKKSEIYLYDGSANSNILSDEAGIGDQKIGFLYVLNGLIYVAYDDNSSDGFSIGWLQGRQIKPLRYFSGTLPDHRQKALYRNTIIFVSNGEIWSSGASVEQLPIQISKLADGGYATVGGIASPFGVPMVASIDGAGNCRLAKFSGYSVDSSWKSVFVDVTSGRRIGKIHTVIVSTKALGSGARCDLRLEGNQGAIHSSDFAIETVDKTRHVIRDFDLAACEDIRLFLNYANGSAVNTCPIRKVVALGNFTER